MDRTAREIADGQIVGWFQGRMEFGPRALGNRSILADPRRPDMKDILNQRIKFREHFRPFCPSVLAEATGEFFETDYPSPFMVQAYRIKPQQRDRIPAVTHQDGTGRLQTVEKDVNPLYWKLLRRFGELTGVPILINTSFNENEPIVNTPAQALDCFLRTNMDVLVIGPFLLHKSENLRTGRRQTRTCGSLTHENPAAQPGVLSGRGRNRTARGDLALQLICRRPRGHGGHQPPCVRRRRKRIRCARDVAAASRSSGIAMLGFGRVPAGGGRLDFASFSANCLLPHAPAAPLRPGDRADFAAADLGARRFSGAPQRRQVRLLGDGPQSRRGDRRRMDRAAIPVAGS